MIHAGGQAEGVDGREGQRRGARASRRRIEHDRRGVRTPATSPRDTGAPRAPTRAICQAPPAPRTPRPASTTSPAPRGEEVVGENHPANAASLAAARSATHSSLSQAGASGAFSASSASRTRDARATSPRPSRAPPANSATTSSAQARGAGARGRPTNAGPSGPHELAQGLRERRAGREQASPSGVEAAPERAPRPAIEVPPSDPGAGAADRVAGPRAGEAARGHLPAARDAVEVRAVPKSAASTAAIEAALRRSVVFEALTSEQAAAVAASMSAAAVARGEAVIAQGDASDAFYVVETGNFEIEIDGAVVATAGPELLRRARPDHEPAGATVRATEDSACWAMDVHLFRHMLASSSATRLGDATRDLGDVDILRGLPDRFLYKLATHTCMESYGAGDRIIAKGSIGDKFYMLKSGAVKCANIGSDDGPLRDVALQRGAHFGERAFTDDRPRACDVFATEPCEVLVLAGADFKDLLGGSLGDVLDRKHALNIALSIPGLEKSAKFPTSKAPLSAVHPGLDLAPEKVDVIYGLFEAVAYEAGAEILEDLGDPAAFLLITGGEVEVSGGGRPSRKASRGDHLGTSHLPYVDSPVRRRSPTNKAWEQAVDLAGVVVERVAGALGGGKRRATARRP
ncbi:cAMP-dependent protein kinase regulator [Aureococcus anophagefferens]|nr:cAMP-dependent protein kinase regulator [Aureococcus anophagefferens]